MSILRRWMLLACGLFWLLLASGGAYPERSISLIVAFAPGGGADLVACALAPYIENHRGDAVGILVLNHPARSETRTARVRILRR